MPPPEVAIPHVSPSPVLAHLNYFEFRNMRNKNIEHGVYGYFLSIAHSLVPKTCSKVYKPKYDTGTITHCLYIFCSVKICPHQFQNGVSFYCIHLMAGILLITIFPFLFYRVDDLLKIIKWILKPKLFTYLYVQIAYLPHVHVYF